MPDQRKPLEAGPLAHTWTPDRVINLASASTIDPLCATLNELGLLPEVKETLHEIADAIFNHGAGTKRRDREDWARRLNAAASKLNTILIRAGAQ
jgi:hypothetical protein